MSGRQNKDKPGSRSSLSSSGRDLCQSNREAWRIRRRFRYTVRRVGTVYKVHR